MSAQIDVLAVLRGLCTRLDRVNLPGGDIPAQEAAALSVACCNTAYAVAELIEASRRAERLLRDMAEAGFGDPAQADDLRAALANVGGAK